MVVLTCCCTEVVAVEAVVVTVCGIELLVA